LRRRLLGRGLYRLLRLGLFHVLVLLSHLSPFQTRFPLLTDGQDPGDLALRQSKPRRVLEGAGRRLEAQVEELLARLVQLPLQLVVREISQLPSFQRDPPPA